jgi:hypothetical protein
LLPVQQKANDKPWFVWPFCTTCSFAGYFDLHQRQPRMIEKYPPARSERNTPSLALQLLYADLQFEIANLSA